MENDKLVESLNRMSESIIRMDEKLTMLLTSQNDHELRIRALEKNDLGRVVPFIIGLLTIVSLVMAIL